MIMKFSDCQYHPTKAGGLNFFEIYEHIACTGRRNCIQLLKSAARRKSALKAALAG
jgi:hypothetical protein